MFYAGLTAGFGIGWIAIFLVAKRWVFRHVVVVRD